MKKIPRKIYLQVLAASVGAFILILAVSLLFAGKGGNYGGPLTEHPLQISELMSKNSAYPNEAGVFCDWIEIHNASESSFDLSGYRLSDSITEAKYTFPSGTILPPDGYLVVWCTGEEAATGLNASFTLSSRGGELVLLLNSANTVIDQVETLQGRRNFSLIRLADGSISVSDAPTPGYPNTADGRSAYLASAGMGRGAVRISEVMSSAELYTSPDGFRCDWVELYNASENTADLSGMRLSDREDAEGYVFPQGSSLAAGEYLVIWCAGEDAPAGYAPFSLNRSGETVILYEADGTVTDRIIPPALPNDTSYAHMDGGWMATGHASPGYANTEAGYAQWIAAAGYADITIRINEVCAKNTALQTDRFGKHSDWIELYNHGNMPVSLGGWFLSDRADPAGGWKLPDISLAPGEYLLVFASGEDITTGELHTDFSLSGGETLTLSTPIGTVADRLRLPETTAENHSLARMADGSWAETDAPTPGSANG